MQVKASWKERVSYLEDLARAAVDGVASVRRQADARVFTEGLTPALCAGAIVGAGVVALRNRAAHRTGASSLIAGSIQGGIIGSAVTLAWMSRRFARLAAGNAARSMAAAADRHWLESHPIDYA